MQGSRPARARRRPPPCCGRCPSADRPGRYPSSPCRSASGPRPCRWYRHWRRSSPRRTSPARRGAPGQGAVQRSLAAHGRQQRVGAFLLDDLGHGGPLDRLDVGRVGHRRVGHDGRGVGVHQDDAVALLAQGPCRPGRRSSRIRRPGQSRWGRHRGSGCSLCLYVLAWDSRCNNQDRVAVASFTPKPTNRAPTPEVAPAANRCRRRNQAASRTPVKIRKLR